MKGVVKFFNRTRGWGFIQAERGQEVFVHFSEVEGSGYRELRKGDRVRFDLVETPKGLQASGCRRDEEDRAEE